MCIRDSPTPPWGYSNYMTQQTIASLTQKLWGDWSVTARGTFYDQSYNTLYNEPWTNIDTQTGRLTYKDAGNFPYRGTNTSRSADIYATGSFRLLHRTHHLLLGFNYNAYNTHVAYGAVNSDALYSDVSINNTAVVKKPAAGSITYNPAEGAESTDDNAYQWGFYGLSLIHI